MAKVPFNKTEGHEEQYSVADPGFPVGEACKLLGGGGGRAPPTWTLFSKNVCKNERIGYHRGWHAPGMPPPPRSTNGTDQHIGTHCRYD